MDETETFRRNMLANGAPEADLAEVIKNGEERWDTEALRREFDVKSFAAPFVIVQRKSNGQKGQLEFTHSPRVYFNWTPHTR